MRQSTAIETEPASRLGAKTSAGPTSDPTRRLYARHRLDIGVGDLARAIALLPATDSGAASRDLEGEWAAAGTGLCCYSVRSGFHLLLSAIALPRGAEVLFSAITHPDMPRLAEHHGLVPVPVDIDTAGLAPRPELLARCVSDRSRVLVVAHLFGGRVDLSLLADFCRRHRLLLVEDCAQAYRGPGHTGDSLADVSMFSFGTLKTSTALGGAILTVRKPEVLERMRSLQLDWPVQKRRAHLRRIAKTASLVALTRPVPLTLVERAARACAVDLDAVVNSAVRAFPAASTDDLVRRLEVRPGAPLLRLLKHRLRTFNRERLLARAASGRRLASILPPGLQVGGLARDHTYWLFPVVADSPDELISRARAAGFDAARSASSVDAVGAPPGRPELEPVCARRIMSRLVFLPAYPELPEGSLDKLASVLKERATHAFTAR